jgi:predicted TIM-barrel fold metal-dependent hydrolase
VRKVISSDGHIQEAADLWQKRLSAPFRERAPYLGPGPEGEDVLFFDGKAKFVPGLPQTSCQRPGLYDVIARAEDLDSQGIDVEVLYPQWTMVLYHLGATEPDFELALLHAYNEWLAETVALVPDRFIGVGLIPVQNVEDALSEVEHIISLGLHGVNIPQSRPEVRYNDERYEPLWTAIERSGLPLTIHAGLGMDHRGPGAVGANVTRNLSSFRNTFPLFVFSGILDRHPGLRLVLTEGGIGWLPSTLYDMDMLYETEAWVTGPDLSLKPSEIWRRQCYSTFMDDPAGLRLVDMFGHETALFGADYPHPEGLFPNTQAVVEQQFCGIAPEVTDAILAGNARRLWGLGSN